MIISTCSFGSTGSSVITDYLKEFGSVKVMDAVELPWISAVDGIVDLEYHLNNPHSRTSDSIYAIERYKKLCHKKASSFERLGVSPDLFYESVERFLNEITQARWMWKKPDKEYGFFEDLLIRIINKTRVIPKWQVKHGMPWEGYPFEEVCFSIKPSNFKEAARRHIKELMSAIGANEWEILAFDQLFPGNNPQCCFGYFDDPYAIVVDRDPRDLYVFGRTVLVKGAAAHIMPISNVEDFVIYYRALRDNQPYKEANARILALRFEDLVYRYEDATKTVRDFLGLPENPSPKSIFDPSHSMANTQVWKRYPQYQKDIECIEACLPEYLYDFTGCPVPDSNARMFSGKSPKNIVG